jgi:hypothetical protein
MVNQEVHIWWNSGREKDLIFVNILFTMIHFRKTKNWCNYDKRKFYPLLIYKHEYEPMSKAQADVQIKPPWLLYICIHPLEEFWSYLQNKMCEWWQVCDSYFGPLYLWCLNHSWTMHIIQKEFYFSKICKNMFRMYTWWRMT